MLLNVSVPPSEPWQVMATLRQAYHKEKRRLASDNQSAYAVSKQGTYCCESIIPVQLRR